MVVEQLVVAAESGQLLPHGLVPDGEPHLEGADFQGVGQQGQGGVRLAVLNLVVGEDNVPVYQLVDCAHTGLLWGFRAENVTVRPVQRVTPPILSRWVSSPEDTMAS